MPPLISVIIPTYNRADLLREALQSLTKQTFRSFEVIISDDGSIDSTREVVEEFSSILNIQYIHQENFGRASRPRNIAIKNAIGQYLAFLDSDDWWVPEKLESSVKFLSFGCDIVYHDLIIFGDGLRSKFLQYKVRTMQLPDDAYGYLLQYGNTLNTSSVVVKKELFLRSGMFPEDQELAYGEDYVAWLNLARLKPVFKRIDAALGYYRVGQESASMPINKLIFYSYLTKLFYNHNNIPTWLNYGIIRAHYQNRDWKECLKQISDVNMFKFKPYDVFKIIIMYLVSIIKK